MRSHVLLLERREGDAVLLREALAEIGLGCVLAVDAAGARRALEGEPLAAIVAGWTLGRTSLEDFLAFVGDASPAAPVLLLCEPVRIEPLLEERGQRVVATVERPDSLFGYRELARLVRRLVAATPKPKRRRKPPA